MNNLRTPPKFLQKPFPYFFMVHLLHRLYGVDAPGYFSAYSLLLFSFFLLFFHFSVAGSVRQVKLTHVGFQARVNISSRIVSYHIMHEMKVARCTSAPPGE